MKYIYKVKKVKTGFIGYCPDMKPVSVFAKTKKELRPKLDACVELYVARHPEVKETLMVGTI